MQVRCCNCSPKPDRKLGCSACLCDWKNGYGLTQFKPKEKPMNKIPEPPTEEMILKAAGKCETVKTALKDLWPGAFEGDKAVVMCPKTIHSVKGEAVAWVSDDQKAIVFNKAFSWERSDTATYVIRLTPTRK